MRRLLVPCAVLVLCFALIQATAACANGGAATHTSQASTPPATVTTAPHSDEVAEGQIRVYSAHVEPSLILFSGTAGLPDGTVLRSQFYQDRTSVAWWPTGQDIAVQNGQWTISVALGDNGSSQKILVGPFYRVNVWEKDDPALGGGYSFSLVGPAPVNR